MSGTSGEASSLPGNSFLKKVWSTSEELPKGDFLTDTKPAPLGWILGSVAIILALVVSLVAYLAIKRSEAAMSDLLAEKGASLIQVFESALRTGMRGEGGLALQTLLDEMAKSPDIEFVAVTMPDGLILAHSDRDRIGEPLILNDQEMNADILASLNPGSKEQWRVDSAENHRVFLLYRHFTLGRKNWDKNMPEPTIFLGMDVSPYEITRDQNRSYIALLSVVTLLVGLVCLLAVGYAQRAAESRHSQHLAESEARRLAREARRNEKLAAVGSLAAGVAHEIRNPLSSIKGYATYFKQLFPDGDPNKEAASVMVREVDRLNRVVTDLLGLSKPDDIRLKQASLHPIAEHVLRMLRPNALERKVNVHLRVAPVLPEIMIDIDRISQVLLNLCFNALDAMPKGGDLTVALAGGANRVCLMVKDTGEGINPKNLPRIFDPYFTTKNSGTGLGLPMAYKIINAHKGHIEAKSTTAAQNHGNSGTTFFVWLNVSGNA